MKRLPRRALWPLGAGAVGYWLWSVVLQGTPRPIADLMAELLELDHEATVYDPCCGTGRLLLAAQRRSRQAGGQSSRPWSRGGGRSAEPRLHGQELNRLALGLARANRAVGRLEARIAGGDGMRSPAFLAADGSLKAFDAILANPMWNQRFPSSLFEEDRYGRFGFGMPPSSDGDWGWMQHMHASLAADGRMAVTFDAEVTEPGDGSADAEATRRIKRGFLEADLVEAVLTCQWPAGRPRRGIRGAILSRALPRGALLIINRRARRPGEVLMIEAGGLLADYCAGQLRAADALDTVLAAHRGWHAVPGLSAVVSTRRVLDAGPDLSPERYVE